jgi:hypothetical protein
MFGATEGSDPFYRPCNSSATVSMCCSIGGSGDTCIANDSLCYNPYANVCWRESCTDPTWQDPACAKLFVNGTGINGTRPLEFDGKKIYIYIS